MLHKVLSRSLCHNVYKCISFSSVCSRRHGRLQQEVRVREEVGGERAATVRPENLGADRSGIVIGGRLAAKKIDIDKKSTTALILQQRPRLAVISYF